MPLKKFETKIKTELESRKIQPSITAWNKLEKKLNKASNNDSVKRYWIAAAVAVVLLLAVGFNLQSPNQVSDTPAMTMSQTIDDSSNFALEEPIDSGQDLNLEISENILPKDVFESKVETPYSSPLKKSDPQLAEMIADVSNREVESNLNVREDLSSNTKPVVLLTLADDIIDPVKSSISDDELDALLNYYRKEVRREIQDQKVIADKAKLLLTDVEKEIDMSFKEQIFDVFLSGAKAVRTAYINRKY
jgi:hypothetical protein